MVDERVVNLLESVEITRDNKVVFKEEDKNLIHEIAKDCRGKDIYKANQERGKHYGLVMSAEALYVDMLIKIANAPTMLHRMSVPILMLPMIDDKLHIVSEMEVK